MEIDYGKLGLKCGLEIHQQLDTNKLFCNCPSLLRKEEPDFTISRRLHAVAGESGEVDVAAKHEAAIDREFIYQGYDTTCLLELDEEPPHEINLKALKITLQIAILLNCKIFPLTQVMRKTVIDGSNTSGFQRTVLIARDGWIDTSEGRVGIESICLEEDAARIIDRKKDAVIYRLDRLGIPLIEIATAPDIKTPCQAKEAALLMGDILRSCKVKRGIGTIRQDVNVSIRGGVRTEIKGFQDIRNIEAAINYEIRRQQSLIKQGKTLEPQVRNVLPDGKSKFLRPMPGEARMYPETDLPILKISREMINKAKKTLPKLRSQVEVELRREMLTDELIKLVLEGHLDDFENLLKIYPKDPSLVAKMLTLWRKELATKLKKDISLVNKVINLDVLEILLQEIKKGKLDKNHIRPIFSDLMKGILLEDAIKREEVDLGEIEESILKIIKSKPGLSEKAYMGLVMQQFKGKIDGRGAIGIIKKYLR